VKTRMRGGETGRDFPPLCRFAERKRVWQSALEQREGGTLTTLFFIVWVSELAEFSFPCIFRTRKPDGWSKLPTGAYGKGPPKVVVFPRVFGRTVIPFVVLGGPCETLGGYGVYVRWEREVEVGDVRFARGPILGHTRRT